MRVIKEHFTHPDASLRFLRFSVGVFGGPWHRHHQIELTWIERGTGIRLVGDNAAPFTSGDLVLLGANVPHVWTSARARNADASVASVLQFPAEILTRTPMPELETILPILARARAGVQITGTCHTAVTRMLIQMRAMNGLRRVSALYGIFDALVRHEKDLRPISTRPTDATDFSESAWTNRDAEKEKRIQQVVAWVQKNLASALRVADAAGIAHVTPAAFSRFFHRETGKTFSKYVNEVRCSTACLSLKNSDKPISFIAEECGFASLSNFNRQFLAQTGATPLKYRHAQ